MYKTTMYTIKLYNYISLVPLTVYVVESINIKEMRYERKE